MRAPGASRSGPSHAPGRMAASRRQLSYGPPAIPAPQMALLTLGESELGSKYPAAIAVWERAWERAWERFTPFLAFPPPVCKVIYTTKAIVRVCPGVQIRPFVTRLY